MLYFHPVETRGEILKVLVPDPIAHPEGSGLVSYFSLAPFAKFLRERLENPQEPLRISFRSLLDRIESEPELLKPVKDLRILERVPGLIQDIASKLFPVSSEYYMQYYSLTAPYIYQIVFYSNAFALFFNPDVQGHVVFPKDRPYDIYRREQIFLALRMVMHRFYGIVLKGLTPRTFGYIDRATGLLRYSRIHIDESFVEVTCDGELPPIPSEGFDPSSATITDQEIFLREFPLDHFTFQGFITRYSIIDATAEHCIAEVQKSLISMRHEYSDEADERMRKAIEVLLECPGVKVSLTPFLQLNDKYIYSEDFQGHSLLLNGWLDLPEREQACRSMANWFSNGRSNLFISDLKHFDGEKIGLDLYNLPVDQIQRCYMSAPIFDENELVGMLEASIDTPGALYADMLQKIEPVFSYFLLACRNSIADFKSQVDATIRELYTSVQSTVSWKFNEMALAYMRNIEKGGASAIGKVSFDQVVPFYGAIDIRHSSAERSRCICEDMMNDLDELYEILKQISGPLGRSDVEKLMYKTSDIHTRLSYGMSVDDEARVRHFINEEAHTLLRSVEGMDGLHTQLLERYLEKSRTPSNVRRKQFESSQKRINNVVTRYLDLEYEYHHQICPMFFERFRTDGVDYNIYIGGSLSSTGEFDSVFVGRIRKWQLLAMINIANMTEELLPGLAVPLRTTQLILAYDHTVRISYRNDEKKFDIDGDEHIRYEVMKKRIDKAAIKGSGERLTQPGKIAIVFAQEKEAEEFEEYIKDYQQQKMLGPVIERFDLEEMQGLSGMKALRVDVIL